MSYNNLLRYRIHVEGAGYSGWYSGGTPSQVCEGEKVEALEIQYSGTGTIEFQYHAEDFGWSKEMEGTLLGGPGSCKRLEVIKLRITNNSASILYRTHVAGYGWQKWSRNFEESGMIGHRIEGIDIRLEESESKGMLRYCGHIENYGWLNDVGMDEECGTTGKSLRLECLKIHYNGVGRLGIKGHVQDLGWSKELFNDEECGTTGKSKRLEAVILNLYDAPGYAVYSSAHVQNIGWMPYVKGGEVCGTTGKSLRMEAIKIKIVKE